MAHEEEYFGTKIAQLWRKSGSPLQLTTSSSAFAYRDPLRRWTDMPPALVGAPNGPDKPVHPVTTHRPTSIHHTNATPLHEATHVGDSVIRPSLFRTGFARMIAEI